MSTAEEHHLVTAMDKKATLATSLTPREIMGVMVAVGIVPPNEDMSLSNARKIYNDVHRTLAGMNFMRSIYQASLGNIKIPQVAAAFPYVLKKEAEDMNVNIDFNPLDHMTTEERVAIKNFARTSLKSKLGMVEDE